MDKIEIRDRLIGENQPCFIIAEVGSNHNGKIRQAKKLIELAKETGADAVKFQSFTAAGLVSRKKISRNNNKWEYNHIFDIVKKFELPEGWHRELFKYCKKIGIIFLSTPFEEKRVDLLNKIGVSAFKIASGDLNNIPFLRYVAKLSKPIILSTGASYLEEVKKAVKVIKKAGNKDIVLLHCVSTYPAKLEDFNLKAMVTLRDEFNLPVGCSDHTLGLTIPIASVALGARVIEKHLTISRRLKGPDHSFSLIPTEFKEMVDCIRKLEEALGDGIKRPVEDELEERIGARRSIYASCDIIEGKTIKKEDLKIVRHAYGLVPEDIYYVTGGKARALIKRDEIITWGKLR